MALKQWIRLVMWTNGADALTELIILDGIKHRERLIMEFTNHEHSFKSISRWHNK